MYILRLIHLSILDIGRAITSLFFTKKIVEQPKKRKTCYTFYDDREHRLAKDTVSHFLYSLRMLGVTDVFSVYQLHCHLTIDNVHICRLLSYDED